MPKSNSQPIFFKSSDLSLVAGILATKKAKLVSSRAVSPYKFEFLLSPTSVCRELEKDYINDRLTVSAKAIADNVRLLKSLIKGR